MTKRSDGGEGHGDRASMSRLDLRHHKALGGADRQCTISRIVP
jgi:hypothetical protein